jgi:cytochrome c oxidase assembly protein Cox11
VKHLTLSYTLFDITAAIRRWLQTLAVKRAR